MKFKPLHSLNMPFTFEIKKSINVILFILKSLGGKADIFELFGILYISELKHLALYGTLITGDDYIAMKNSVVPFNLYSIYRQLKGEGYLRNFANNFKEYLAIDEEEKIVAITDYNAGLISVSEANCLFEAIRENKNEDPTFLKERIMGYGWINADSSNNITVIDMAISAGASDTMLTYIKMSLINETTLLNENNAS